MEFIGITFREHNSKTHYSYMYEKHKRFGGLQKFLLFNLHMIVIKLQVNWVFITSRQGSLVLEYSSAKVHPENSNYENRQLIATCCPCKCSQSAPQSLPRYFIIEKV